MVMYEARPTTTAPAHTILLEIEYLRSTRPCGSAILRHLQSTTPAPWSRGFAAWRKTDPVSELQMG
jgi:hypothetical protein